MPGSYHHSKMLWGHVSCLGLWGLCPVLSGGFRGRRSWSHGPHLGDQVRSWPHWGTQVHLAVARCPAAGSGENRVLKEPSNPFQDQTRGATNHNSWMSLTFSPGLSAALEGVFGKRLSDTSPLWRVPRVHRADTHCQREPTFQIPPLWGPSFCDSGHLATAYSALNLQLLTGSVACGECPGSRGVRADPETKTRV